MRTYGNEETGQITVFDARATLDEAALSGPMTFTPVAVPLDEASDLADTLLGGPRITFSLRGTVVSRFSGLTWYRYSVWVRAFIEDEAYEALTMTIDLAALLFAAGQRPQPAYRLRDGKLIADPGGVCLLPPPLPAFPR
jgi:hypothetical protein